MGKPALTRMNLLLEHGKVHRLRKSLRSKSNSEAVRQLIDEHLNAEAGVRTLRSLKPIDDVFGRAPRKK
jgi:hypothetical protein